MIKSVTKLSFRIQFITMGLNLYFTKKELSLIWEFFFSEVKYGDIHKQSRARVRNLIVFGFSTFSVSREIQLKM